MVVTSARARAYSATLPHIYGGFKRSFRGRPDLSAAGCLAGPDGFGRGRRFGTTFGTTPEGRLRGRQNQLGGAERPGRAGGSRAVGGRVVTRFRLPFGGRSRECRGPSRSRACFF